MKSPSDEELVQLLARGDQRAFETVYQRCRVPLFRFAMHMSGSREVADEISQETFLFLLQKPNAYSQQKGALLHFLIGVARNLFRHSRRSFSDDLSIEDNGVENMVSEVDTMHSPLDFAIRQQSAASLQSALLEVPQAYREVVILCDLQEMSYAETAAALGIPVGTVRSRLHRGHVALLDLLSRRSCIQNSGAKS